MYTISKLSRHSIYIVPDFSCDGITETTETVESFFSKKMHIGDVFLSYGDHYYSMHILTCTKKGQLFGMNLCEIFRLVKDSDSPVSVTMDLDKDLSKPKYYTTIMEGYPLIFTCSNWGNNGVGITPSQYVRNYCTYPHIISLITGDRKFDIDKTKYACIKTGKVYTIHEALLYVSEKGGKIYFNLNNPIK